MTETDESVKHRESSDAVLWGTGGITGGTRTSRNPDETCDPDKERHIFTIGLERLEKDVRGEEVSHRSS